MKQGWEIKKLNQISENLDNRRVPITKSVRSNGTIPYYGASGIVDYVEEYIFDEDLLLVSEDGANLLARTYPIAFSISGKTWVNNHAHVLKFNTLTTQKFVEIYLNSIKLDDFVSGMAQPKLNQGMLNQIPIPLPPLPEQQRIVSILDEAFAAIAKAKANAEQNLRNAKELFESYLLKVLSDKKWETKTIGNVCTKVEYGSATKSKNTGKIAVLRMGNIQNSRFDWEKLVYSDDEKDNKQYLLKYNDVLFNRTNSPELVGKTAIYKSEMPAIFAGYLIRIHRKEDLIDADFLNYYLNSEIALEYGKTVVISSVNQANINGTKLKGYPIPCPPLIDQQTIVQKLDVLSAETKKLEAIYQQKIDGLEEMKKSILQKAFSGGLHYDSGE